MTDANERAVIGGNLPPNAIDDALAPFGDIITEAESWLDGHAVENEAQMKSVDALLKGIKSARKAVDDARDAVTKPLHEVWKGEVARWKPTQDDLDRIVSGLVAVVDGFKRKLAAEKAEAARLAQAKAWEETRKAQEAARMADASNIEATRAAAAQIEAAEHAQRLAAIAEKDTVKGLRTFDVTEVMDVTAYAKWLWANDRVPLVEWMTDHARKSKHHVPGVVETRKEKRAA